MSNIIKGIPINKTRKLEIVSDPGGVVDELTLTAHDRHGDQEIEISEYLDGEEYREFCYAHRIAYGYCPRCGEKEKDKGCEYCLP